MVLPLCIYLSSTLGFPDGSAGKESTCNAGDLGSIPGLGRFPGEGNRYPLQYSCLENSMDKGAYRSQRVRCDSATFTFQIKEKLFTSSLTA